MAQDFPAWTFERRIDSDLAAGHRIREELLGKLQTENWTKRDLFGIGLALEEAIVNAIKHGNRLDKNKRVRVVCKSTREKIWIEISDEGPGFNLELVPDCTDEAHIECPNGRGIMLMRNFMSRVDYNRSGNAVIMEKLRTAGV